MKKKLLVKSIIIIAFTLLIFSMQVQANVPTNANFEEIASKALVNLKLMMGDEQGNLNLKIM